MNVSRRPCRRRGATYLGAISLAVASAALLAIPAGASASSVTCGGTLRLQADSDAGPRGVRYSVKCTEDVLAYSIHTSKKIDYFTPDPVVHMPDGEPAEEDHFSCEGPIPGPGFGCPGAMTAGNRVEGWFGTVPPRCNPTIQAWATVTTQQLDSGGDPFITISQPFRLQPPKSCPSPAKNTAVSANDRGSTSSIFAINPIFGTLA